MSDRGFRPGSFGRRALRVAILLVAVAGAIGLLRWLLAGTPATGDAEWIWAPRSKASITIPAAFYVYRDFRVEPRPARARLLIEAEEEYFAWLNGRPVGGGSFVLGEPLDVYAVGDLLLEGENRLVVELRSSNGGGGLLADLQGAGPEPAAFEDLVASDGEWRVARQWDPGLEGGWSSPGIEQVLVWGAPPIGRWGVPELGAERPVLAELGRPPGALPGRPGEVVADRGAAGLDIAWPAEVTGYLSLELDPDSSRLGLVHLEGEDLVPVVVPNGAPRWIDAVPRRWSRARLSGLDGVRAVRVEELPTRAVADLLRPAPAAPAGLFGIHPPPLRTPLMQQVRREVQEAD